MLLGIIGTLMVGVAAACFLFIATRLSKGWIPRWIIPAGSAVAMFAYYIWSDYSWYYRTVAEFPESVVVTDTYDFSFILQPWTYVVPRINRFTAINIAEVQSNKTMPEYRLAELLLVTQNEPTVVTPLMIDCKRLRCVFLKKDTEFFGNGLPKKADWLNMRLDNPLYLTLCSSENVS